ncbi:DNA polymerase III subunit delta [Lysinibacillus sphaericus]|uniref:DNA polymerase III subunit delta n=1 Tax=Lysinibacillus sphaericus (strain C3-41) TaxID=444177 RepID=B1I0J7_LYSSC|nr:DNA polymerase III subunit delta [Lysinibacillus sphaericus]MBE5085797.1 DNA polymerase III subunit delta [Bacillus thuringiensis]ACA42356.1 Hypothetical yqeN protein [Lysinibacillus sphaericus C3-41]AMO35340.1 hypothetical protein AR327_22885 [Lysinibacillus sphaericus]AMR93057.1 hypothetical protein A1T07_22900 [Lysinibacillus sphaericus]MBG9710603.1 hypothetical protein [Lysinibacillus sphaericus]
MIHLLFGTEDFLIAEKKKEICRVEGVSISSFDMRETSLTSALEDAQMSDLFGGKKIVFLNDSYFLTGDTSKKITHDTDALLDYLESPNPDSTVVLVVNNEKLDKRKKVVKELLQKATTTFEAKPLYNAEKWLVERCKVYGKTLTRQAAVIMQQQLGKDLFLLDTELTKLVLAVDNPTISEKDLEGVLSRTLEGDVFKIVDHVIYKRSEALEILDDLFRLGHDSIQILLILAGQFRLIHQVKAIHELGESPKNILKGIHPYRLSMAEEQCQLYSIEDLQQRLKDCAELDLQMKRGYCDKVIGLETLILKWL